MSMNLSNIAILNMKGSDYRCIYSGIRKYHAINLMQITDLMKEGRKVYRFYFSTMSKLLVILYTITLHARNNIFET